MKQQNENEESNAVSVSVQSDRTFLATEPIGQAACEAGTADNRRTVD